MRVKINLINALMASLTAVNAAIVSSSSSKNIPVTKYLISTKTISTKTIPTKTIPSTTTENVNDNDMTTLTYKKGNTIITHTMVPPQNAKTMKLVCSTTKANSEYCTEVYDSEKKDIIYECYNLYKTMENTQESDVGPCAIYTIPVGQMEYKMKTYCDEYKYIQDNKVQTRNLCRAKFARYVSTDAKKLDPDTLVPLDKGFTYTSALLNTKYIKFPVPEKVTDVTINCPVSPIKDDSYTIFSQRYGYVYSEPTSVPFSIIKQDYTTQDNPAFTATTIAIKASNEIPFKTIDSATTGVLYPGKSIPNTLPSKKISDTKSVPLGTEPENIYMGSLITYSDGSITTKMPIVSALLNYCDEYNTNLCYGAYAVTDTCTIYTRASATKTVPPDLITSTTSKTLPTNLTETEISSSISSPTITGTPCPKCLPNTACKSTEVTVTEYACSECPKCSVNAPCKATVTNIQTTTVTEKDTVTVTVTVKDNLAVNCKKKYEQCGGKNYQGISCCESGLECRRVDDYFHQCS